MKSILTAEGLEDKRVLVRVDWNVPIVGGKVADDFRIRESLPTLEYLQQRGAQVIIATHLDPDSASIEPLRPYVPKGVELLENLRNNPGEKGNDHTFAEMLASKADIYVNEAFSASHREHASIISVPKLLPSYAGIRFMQEVENLSRFFHPEHPFLFILGGAKFETKLPLLKKFSSLADTIFVGGALAHNFFRGEGIEIGHSLVSSGDFDTKTLLDTGKIVLPIDPVWHEDRIVDAGPKTFEDLKKRISGAKLILWNGPLGLYEEGFKTGTLELARMIADSGKTSVIGGADTLAATKELGIQDKFTFVSSAGGAMLDFLAHETLPGIEALN